MTTPLQVLLIESDPSAGDAHARQLGAAGHEVHRCYAEARTGRVPLRDRYLCTGVTAGRCPLEAGVDVALLVRSRLATSPGRREAGVSCALRAGVAVVEDGPEVLDPYEPWLAARVDGDTVAACEAAAAGNLAALAREVSRRVELVLRGAGIDPGTVACRVLRSGVHLRVVLSGPAIQTSTRSALAVRALDAVRSSTRRTLGQVDVDYVERAA